MITFSSVSFRYDSKLPWVLQDVSFTISKGELVAIVGKNGAGKTTLIKHINGLLQPVKGEVFIDSENIAKKPVSKIAQVVGLAFQNPNHQLFAETVEKELAFGPKNLGQDEKKVREIIKNLSDIFQIEHLLERSPFDLSGGEQRLVSIASVLTMNQKVLVLDEPSYGQDYRQKKRLAKFLLQLQNKGQTIILVSHDIDFILDFVPRVLVIDKGKIIADGSPLDIFCQPQLLKEADLTKPVLLDLCLTIQQKCPTFLTSVQEQEIISDLLQRIKQPIRRKN